MSARQRLERACGPVPPPELIADLDAYRDEVLREAAERIRANADSPTVKPHLLDGEWTGMRMAADLLHLRSGS